MPIIPFYTKDEDYFKFKSLRKNIQKKIRDKLKATLRKALKEEWEK